MRRLLFLVFKNKGSFEIFTQYKSLIICCNCKKNPGDKQLIFFSVGEKVILYLRPQKNTVRGGAVGSSLGS
jgi:hypothetical protein